MQTLEDIFGEAWMRGHQLGLSHKRGGVFNDSPLSGEWAGESIPELLGDLIRQASTIVKVRKALKLTSGHLDESQLLDEICTEYEGGYLAAHSGPENA